MAKTMILIMIIMIIVHDYNENYAFLFPFLRILKVRCFFAFMDRATLQTKSSLKASKFNLTELELAYISKRQTLIQ